jgi:hypothetical protein
MNLKKRLFYLAILMGVSMLFGCGKPNDAEEIPEIPDEDKTGGYFIVKKFPTSGYAQDLIKKDNLLYLAQGEGGMMIINVANPENPQMVSIQVDSVRGYSSKIIVKDTVAYLAAGTFGINVINVVNPLDPFVTVQNLNIKPASNFHIMGNYLFTAISEQGVKIADISYPEVPDIRDGINSIGYASALVTTSDSAKMLIASGEMGLSIYDISVFQNGYGEYPLLGWCDTPGYAEDIIIAEDQFLAFLACGTAGLQIINYSDSTNLHIVGSYDAAGYAKELKLYDNKVFMTTELSGLLILDVSDVTKPAFIGEIETEFALALEVDDPFIYVADEDEGLIIISFPVLN